MKRKEFIISLTLSGIILGLLIYIVSTLGNKVTLDATEESIYTLSDGSKKIVQKINTPIKLKLYYSKTAANKGSEGIRTFNNYFEYIRQLLNEYVHQAPHALTLEVIDPRPDTREEEDALFYGLKKFNLTETESYFFGLVVKNETGGEKVIDFFDPGKQDSVEYDITKTIYSVIHTTKKRVGILSPLTMVVNDVNPYMAQLMQLQGKRMEQTWPIVTMMRDFFEVKKIDLTTDKIENIDVLLVVHPTVALQPKIKLAIDQYLLRGGKILLLIDPHYFADTNNQMLGIFGTSVFSSSTDGMSELFGQLGLKIGPQDFAGDRALAEFARVSAEAPPQKMVALVHCDQRCNSPYRDVVTHNLNDLMFILPGALGLVNETGHASLTYTPILSTTKEGNRYQLDAADLRSPDLIERRFASGKKEVVLAYKIVGKFKTAFPNGLNGGDQAAKPPADQLLESKKEGAVIVISDVDFIHESAAFRPAMTGMSAINNNASLLLNALDNLSGSADLLSIRSRTRISRSFDVIEAIELEAQKRTAYKVAQINQDLQRYGQELRNLAQDANSAKGDSVKAMEIEKSKEIMKHVGDLRNELRDVRRQEREKVENIGLFFQYLNTLFIPLLVAITGIWMFLRRERITKQGGRPIVAASAAPEVAPHIDAPVEEVTAIETIEHVESENKGVENGLQ